MSKQAKTCIFDKTLKKYFLKIHKSTGFMEPHIKYQLINKDLILRGASVLNIRIKYGCESKDLQVLDLEKQFESLSIDSFGVNSNVDFI